MQKKRRSAATAGDTETIILAVDGALNRRVLEIAAVNGGSVSHVVTFAVAELLVRNGMRPTEST